MLIRMRWRKRTGEKGTIITFYSSILCYDMKRREREFTNFASIFDVCHIFSFPLFCIFNTSYLFPIFIFFYSFPSHLFLLFSHLHSSSYKPFRYLRKVCMGLPPIDSAEREVLRRGLSLAAWVDRERERTEEAAALEEEIPDQ